ncbi:hypothetical protein L3V82_11545 [Thiotrichales bacterium 19S3-7]|nr:hypothetical protein [Thiotrichales bacterium 19S3-7]
MKSWGYFSSYATYKEILEKLIDNGHIHQLITTQEDFNELFERYVNEPFYTIYLEDIQFVEGVRKIYKALLDGQDSIIKEDNSNKLLDIDSIKAYILVHPDGRAAKACELFFQHYAGGIDSGNLNLVSDIYRYVNTESSRFFQEGDLLNKLLLCSL